MKLKCYIVYHFKCLFFHMLLNESGGMSTYKELCDIATDLNQPDLIYKFMHLANHNATWNARKVCITFMFNHFQAKIRQLH